MTRERTEVEDYLHDAFVQRSGTTRKFVSPGRTGVADRICMLPGGRIWFIECKTLSGRESPVQVRERHRMIALGFDARVVYGRDGVDALMKEIDLGLLQ